MTPNRNVGANILTEDIPQSDSKPAIEDMAFMSTIPSSANSQEPQDRVHHRYGHNRIAKGLFLRYPRAQKVNADDSHEEIQKRAEQNGVQEVSVQELVYRPLGATARASTPCNQAKQERKKIATTLRRIKVIKSPQPQKRNACKYAAEDSFHQKREELDGLSASR